MKALIDGDIVCFRCAASAEHENELIARYYVDRLLDQLLQETKADEFEIFLTGPNNFRYDVYPEYKANRDDADDPRYRQYLKDYLISLKATVSDGCEADDLMGVAQCTADTDTVIVSLDKDMLTIPGMHYSWEISGGKPEKRWTKPAIWTNQTEIEALRWFYTQVITGDVTDNIKGIPGRGKAFARDLLTGLETEKEMFDAVREAYDHDDSFIMNARCIYIWKKPNDDWRETFNRLSGGNEAGIS